MTVPRIVGNTEEEALKLLESFGLTGKKTGEKTSEEHATGEVCSQSPGEGEVVPKGSAVSYEVTAAGDEIILSDLSNIEQSQAQAFLLTKGLKCEIDTSRQSDTVEEGHVITTDPAAGTTLSQGDTVTLFISQKAADDSDYVQLWDLYGYTKERAAEALAMLELEAEYQYEASSEVGEGLVISQMCIRDRLCSDGLTNMVDDDEILHIVKKCASPQEAAQRLVTEANKNGGKDNVSVVLAEF